MKNFHHTPVMPRQCIDALNIKPDGIYVDGTCGGAGHSFLIAKKLSGGRLYAFDTDPDAVAAAGERLTGLPATVIHANFRDADALLARQGVKSIDGVLLDLGVSSYQLDTPERGFSYAGDSPLDMRMSKEGQTARDLVNSLPAEALRDIFRKYGEEKHARRIAEKIVRIRNEAGEIKTTSRLADIVASAYTPRERRKGGNPSRKVFQALRIAVNDELGALEEALEKFFSILSPGGRMRIITFHSLEDRIVKQYFRTLTAAEEDMEAGVFPPPLKRPKAVYVNKKPLTADPGEQRENRRARSAKLRTIEKV